MDKFRPYVTAALLCEKVLQEKDESLTIVRIADRVQYRIEGPAGLPEGIKPVVQLQGLVSIKSGPVTGRHVIKIVAEKPKGDRNEMASFSMEFLGKDQGHNIILKMALGVEQDGLYWFDVLLDEDVITRIPLMVSPAPKQVSEDQKSRMNR